MNLKLNCCTDCNIELEILQCHIEDIESQLAEVEGYAEYLQELLEDMGVNVAEVWERHMAEESGDEQDIDESDEVASQET